MHAEWNQRVDSQDWPRITRELDAQGWSCLPSLLQPAECEALLDRHTVGRIAYAFGRHIEIVPIHYVRDGAWLYGRTSPGALVVPTTASDMATASRGSIGIWSRASTGTPRRCSTEVIASSRPVPSWWVRAAGPGGSAPKTPDAGHVGPS